MFQQEMYVDLIISIHAQLYKYKAHCRFGHKKPLFNRNGTICHPRERLMPDRIKLQHDIFKVLPEPRLFTNYKNCYIRTYISRITMPNIHLHLAYSKQGLVIIYINYPKRQK